MENFNKKKVIRNVGIGVVLLVIIIVIWGSIRFSGVAYSGNDKRTETVVEKYLNNQGATHCTVEDIFYRDDLGIMGVLVKYKNTSLEDSAGCVCFTEDKVFDGVYHLDRIVNVGKGVVTAESISINSLQMYGDLIYIIGGVDLPENKEKIEIKELNYTGWNLDSSYLDILNRSDLIDRIPRDDYIVEMK